MPIYQGKKVGVMVYMTPETYAAVQKIKGNFMTDSSVCGMLLEEILVPENVEELSKICAEC